MSEMGKYEALAADIRKATLELNRAIADAAKNGVSVDFTEQRIVSAAFPVGILVLEAKISHNL